MSSFFSCLGKKSKSKKKKNGKPPEARQVDELSNIEVEKQPSIEEPVPADKINGNLKTDDSPCEEPKPTESEEEPKPVECEEEPQQVTLIKELKSKLSVKANKSQNEKTEETMDDGSVGMVQDKSLPGANAEGEQTETCSEIIEKSVIKSVESEIVKIESKSKEEDSQRLSKSESSSETKLKQTNASLSEQNKTLRKACEDNGKELAKQAEELSKLKQECCLLNSIIKDQEKLKDTIKEREDIMLAIEELTDICSSLKLRLDEVENEKNSKSSSSLAIESKITTVDSDHKEINVCVKNVLRSVQELECRVINLELDKENDKECSNEILAKLKELELMKSNLQEELNAALKKETDQLNKINSLESQVDTLTVQISELQQEKKDFQTQVEESTKCIRVKDDKLSSLQTTEKNLQSTIHNLETKLNHFEARHKSESDEIAVLKKKLDKLEAQLREKEIAHQETIGKLAEAQNKHEELQKRINDVPIQKVQSNGFSVQSDDSDDCSIMVSEKFRDLYGSIWKEAFEKLHRVCKRDERKVLQILMEYLTECYLYCRRTARHQMDALLSLLCSPTNMRGSLNKRLQGKNSQIESIPDELKLKLMQFRRTPSENFTDSMFEEFMQQIDYQKSRHLRNIQARDIAEVTPFVRKCIGVCWELVTQEPPMYLLFKLRHNQIIERERFDVYSGDGNKVDFLIWPAVLRDENGPLLQKGVVQAVRS